ncbi:sarcosine oxidase subunit gamma [Ostreiculturibacter nitratireducens]|uniref:sarcosine oxidase subunit gamma n=1 Tax=Ostreiculturibacter nitratireducens TaxID=3075226 RepID=UPI0031B5B3EF
MASLIEKTPCEGLLPVTAQGSALSELRPGPITSVAPFNGQERAVSSTLKGLGLSFPGPGKTASKGGASAVWTGRGQAFLIGTEPPEGLAEIAALTDQSDGWAAMRLEGEKAEAVLARLAPLDLRMAEFGKGAVARAALGHIPMILIRSGASSFDIYVFRSMAASAVHELHVVMKAVAARGKGI